MAKMPLNITFLVSYDWNDTTTNNVDVLDQFEQLGAITIPGTSLNKIHAVNRDMEEVYDWDIVVLMSDDMECVQHGWDEILIDEMNEHFPDTDGCLFHWDGDLATARHNDGQGLCTMNIMGRKYFDRFGYFYHPSYKSLWCDNEFTDVAFRDGKMFKSDKVLFKHNHYSNNGTKPDPLMIRTQAFYKLDEFNYHNRKRLNFPK